MTKACVWFLNLSEIIWLDTIYQQFRGSSQVSWERCWGFRFDGAQDRTANYTTTHVRTVKGYLQVEFHELVDGHNCSLVTAAVAVVRRTKHCDYVAVVGPVVTLHHKLMGTGDSCQVVGVVELLRNILAETVSSTSWRNTPAASIIRVRPQQVAHGTFLWHLLNSVELSNLVESVDAGWETTVEAENLILNDSCKGQEVEKLCEYFPYVGIAVFSEALVVESIANTPYLSLTQKRLTLGWSILIRGYLWGW